MSLKIKTSEAVLLLLPVLFLAGAALFLAGRDSTATKPGLHVTSVQFKPLPNVGRATRRVGITVFVHYQDREPAWWKKGGRAHWLQNLKFVNATGHEYGLESYSVSQGRYDAARQCHVLLCTCSVPEGYNITQPGTFQGTAMFADQLVPLKALGVARFSVPVRLS